MKLKNILLVEDDFLNRRLTKKLLLENNYSVLEAQNADDTFSIIKSESVDFVILDINLGDDERDGISIAQEIKTKHQIPFTFLTAYDHSEIINKALDSNPSSFLTKPFKNTDLIAAIELGIRQYKKPTKATLFVKEDGYTFEILTDDICYLEANRNYLQVHTQNKIYSIRNTISNIIESLPANTFVQVHRAFIINKDKIDKLNKKKIIINNLEIPISKNYVEDYRQLYGEDI